MYIMPTTILIQKLYYRVQEILLLWVTLKKLLKHNLCKEDVTATCENKTQIFTMHELLDKKRMNNKALKFLQLSGML